MLPVRSPAYFENSHIKSKTCKAIAKTLRNSGDVVQEMSRAKNNKTVKQDFAKNVLVNLFTLALNPDQDEMIVFEDQKKKYVLKKTDETIQFIQTKTTSSLFSKSAKTSSTPLYQCSIAGLQNAIEFILTNHTQSDDPLVTLLRNNPVLDSAINDYVASHPLTCKATKIRNAKQQDWSNKLRAQLETPSFPVGVHINHYASNAADILFFFFDGQIPAGTLRRTSLFWESFKILTSDSLLEITPSQKTSLLYAILKDISHLDLTSINLNNDSGLFEKLCFVLSQLFEGPEISLDGINVQSSPLHCSSINKANNDKCMTSLTYFLKNNPNLSAITLKNCYLFENGLSGLIDAIQSNDSITELHLINCGINNKDIQSLADHLKKGLALKTVSILDNMVSLESTLALMNNDTLTSLNLQSNHFHETELNALLTQLKRNPTLTTFNINWRENTLLEQECNHHLNYNRHTNLRLFLTSGAAKNIPADILRFIYFLLGKLNPSTNQS